MKPTSTNEKFLELCKELENFVEDDIKHLVSCVHALWLTGDEKRIEEAVKYMATLASNACDEYRKGKKAVRADFDLENWNPGEENVIQ